MSDIKQYLIEKFKLLKGQHILTHGKVWRLIAIGSGYDYYYVLWDGRKFCWETALSRITPLKGNIPDEHYDLEYIRIAKLNHIDQFKTEEYDGLEEVKKELQKHVDQPDVFLGKELWYTHELITEPCWDLN